MWGKGAFFMTRRSGSAFLEVGHVHLSEKTREKSQKSLRPKKLPAEDQESSPESQKERPRPLVPIRLTQ
jgi:hypothetical protein